MVPKGFKTNININPSKIGPDRRQELLDNIANNGTFLPRGVSEEDMDAAFIEYMNNELSITLNDEKTPVIFLTIQRWSEFTKTWQFSNEYKNIVLPFITVVRRPDIQMGTNQAGLWNIPGRQTYTYMKVPTFDGSRKGVDLYKIPQPTSVDITYEVRLFTNRMRDLNTFNSLIHKTFQSRQAYIFVKGHPMPIILEAISDESNIEEFENRRFYVQEFEIKLMGYILDEADFQVIPTINRVYTMLELDDNKPANSIVFDPYIKNNELNYTIVFKPRANTTFSFNAKYNLKFTQLLKIANIQDVKITINSTIVFEGLELTEPLYVNANDLVTIQVNKNFLQTGSFELIGNSL
jgi:hypothetical protein